MKNMKPYALESLLIRDGNWLGLGRVPVNPYPHPFIKSIPLPNPIPVGYPINITHRFFEFSYGYRVSPFSYYTQQNGEFVD